MGKKLNLLLMLGVFIILAAGLSGCTLVTKKVDVILQVTPLIGTAQDNLVVEKRDTIGSKYNIAEVQYPTEVSANQTFQVGVNLKYSFANTTKTLIQVYEHAGPLLGEKIDNLVGSGLLTYYFDMESPSTSQTWQLNIQTFHYAEGDWVQDDIKSVFITVKDEQNLLANPNFEDGLSEWHTSDGNATYRADGLAPINGKYAAKGVEQTKSSLGRLYQDVTMLVTPGNWYQISGWIKTEEVDGMAVIGLDFVNDSGWTPTNGYVKEIGFVNGTLDWTYFISEPFEMPPMPPGVTAVWFLFDFNAGRGTAYWDDVALTPVSPGFSSVWEPCPNTYLSRLHLGDFAYVSFYPPLANNVCDNPGMEAAVIGQIDAGEEILVLEGPACSNHWVWWLVRSRKTGLIGWTSEGDIENYWLVPLPEE